MSSVTYQNDPSGSPQPQTQTGNEGAADVNVTGGVVGIDQSQSGATNAVTNLPTNIAGSACNNITTAVYVNSLIVKASAGKLYGFSGYNSKGSTQFILVFDSATLPADTTGIPKIVISVAASSNFSYDAGMLGRSFNAGIVICNSSTGPTKTIGSADCWLDVQAF